jgi:hypothetical protein
MHFEQLIYPFLRMNAFPMMCVVVDTLYFHLYVSVSLAVEEFLMSCTHVINFLRSIVYTRLQKTYTEDRG